MSKFENNYKNILLKCLNKGIYRDDRTGVGCYSLFNKSIKFNISNKFPMITGRKIFQKTFDTEFEWFINGETNIKRFKNNGVKIWNEWADENGDLGPVYGHQLRNFNSNNIDQLNLTIEQIKLNPNSRRHIINLWNPIQLNDMKLPPCYLYFQFFVDNNKLNMFVLQRSGDLFLGVPYDIALFSKLLLFISEKTNLQANKVEIQIVDAHIYKNQIESVEEYLAQQNFKLPTYLYNNNNLIIQDYKYSKVITCKPAV
jgi:thymidylate synthase